VNKVLSMNKFDEMTGHPLKSESPKKNFGLPLPGEPSLMYTIQKNELMQLQQAFAETTSLLTGKFVSAPTMSAGNTKFTTQNNDDLDEYEPPEIHRNIDHENVF